ncbi:GroES-like protein [Trametes versicolor FP-101664 SS1]|uniref:GroES-like protein n=1 Tax=Trametes versicolor (strain FP-101664) TaxID=717944 RepID=UPI000462301E|nr:GroES-like protein [Trametes versicolor FP-101664 SS1]EIW57183.1 GroES-like protein [Trametes versicolor FP-101664 SS1]
MTPTTQKALVLPAIKGEWVVSEVSVPTPGPKEVLVKIIAAGLNPADWKIQAYGIEWVPYPFIGGSDAAGVVEEVGAEVTNLTKGDKVFYQAWFNTRKSAFQQYGIVPAEIAAKIPDNITFDQAASIPLGLNTVAIGLYNHTPNTKSVDYPAPWEQGGTTKFAGKPAFVLGGSSTVGQYAIQLARLSGFSPIITTSSLRHEEFLTSIGATHIIDRTLPSDTIQAEVTKLAGHKPVEYVYDSISSAETQQLGYEVLAPGGDLLLVNPQAIPAEKKKTSDNKKILNVFADVQAPENRDVVVGIWSHITELFATGKLVPSRVEVLPNGLAGIPDGLVRLQKEQVSGQKLIAHPQETP